MEHTTNKSDAPTDPLSGATPANRRTRHIRGALAATTSVGMLFGAGTAVAGASSATASGTHKAPHTRAAFRHDDACNAGTVTSVDGTSTTGTCGTASGSGAIVVNTFKGATRTYDVDPSTTFVEPGITSAGFNNVCVGDTVAVRPAHGSSAGDTGSTSDSGATGDTGTPATAGVTARKVFIAPTPTPVPPTSVPPTLPAPTTSAPSAGSMGSVPTPTVHPQPLPNGSPGSRPVPTPGSPEVRGIVSTKDPSSFDVNSNGQSQVVDVTDTTTYVGPGGPTTYGSVAAGDAVRVSGTDVNGAFTATSVSVFPAPSSSGPSPQPGVPDGTTPSPTAPGFPARPAPAPVTSPSPSGQGGQGQSESPQSQGFSRDGSPAGAAGGHGG